ncbi:hypothetical protein JZ751_011435 [Albula glossodonta]|uniref:SH3 domain-binding protein 5 n=1 Tax=Albula glossodonta TaxID=121402 RepID=A0A8T2N6R4_9TELE|nr:hypothetical protein JZ751_011435 [Albula glossodonta]
MEPGSLRESPAGSGDPERSELREEKPDGEAEEKDVKKQVGSGENMDSPGKTEVECKYDSSAEKAKNEDRKSEEELDPRIQEELEQLNQASEEINMLELQLDEARSSYRKILTDSARKLNTHGAQLGTAIEKARPYYEARRLAKEAQQETQKAALSYERAVSMHAAAREMVYVAEQGLLADRNTMDPTWQEMLNHATCKVNEAEEERLRSEKEHMRVTQQCQEAEAKVQALQKSLRRVILKSRPYFELKAQFNLILEDHKRKVMQLEDRVSKVKTRYSVALRNLEQISEQIHAQRGQGKDVEGRSSPVGAEADNGVGEVEGAGLRGRSWEEAGKDSDWVGRFSGAGWGEGLGDGAGSGAGLDSVSLLSLQTIASDLEKCDSVEHLGELSDSLSGEEWDKDREKGEAARREKGTTAEERQQNFLKQHQRSVSL